MRRWDCCDGDGDVRMRILGGEGSFVVWSGFFGGLVCACSGIWMSLGRSILLPLFSTRCTGAVEGFCDFWPGIWRFGTKSWL